MDMFGDYSYMFYMCGAILLTAGLFLFAMNYYNYRRQDAARRVRENGAELAERNIQDRLTLGDASGDQEEDKPRQDTDSGTLRIRAASENVPV